MKLVLVESPTKARTLSKFLGKEYRIEASFGHLRDLPKGDLGVDVENNFTPKYVIPRDKAKRVKELKGLVSDKVETIILATDPDREGEAISYHLAVIFSQKGAKITSEKIDTPRFQRISFHEITEAAIKEALSHSGQIDMLLVNAQQARRVLDRLVGYKLSPLVQKKLARNHLSAGRVQSVSVRIIVEREREIKKFQKEEYWVIEGEFGLHVIPHLMRDPLHSSVAEGDFSPSLPTGIRNDKQIKAKLISKDSIKYEQSQTVKLFDGSYTYTKSAISSQPSALSIVNDFKSPFTVSAVDKKETKRYPAPPYTTSALQIDAGRKLGFSSKRIMQLAQNLYEQGLITYHRTDSVNLATKFLGAAKNYIEKTYGKQYSHYRTYTTKSKLAQEAHEAIRPTDVGMTNNQFPMTNGLDEQHKKLYDLIWKRAVASQMSEAVFDSTTIDITSTNNYLFQVQGSVVKFDGFLKVTGYDADTVVLPDVTEGETVELKKTLPQQKFTSPPPRYSEASLIKALEEDGIGRPSTYAPTIVTIQDRLYVEKETKEDGKKGRNFIPTELGYLVSDFLVKYFPEIVDLTFTATMEDGLDEIADGKREWIPMLAEFYTPFAEKLTYVQETVPDQEKHLEKTGEKCPKCKKGDVVVRESKFGKFLGCSLYPECDYKGYLIQKIGVSCPTCKQGDVIVKKTKTGRIFYGCSRYPSCNFASWTKPK